MLFEDYNKKVKKLSKVSGVSLISTIYKMLKNYKNKNIYPFHMPGHKRNKNFFDFEFLDFDITEIPEMDNLNDPKDSILKTNEFLAGAFCAEQSYMLVNGSTSGIVASIATVCKDGDGILIARNSHRSAYSGMIISNARPYFILPEVTDFYLPASISPDKVKSILSNHQDIKAVFITSPTYEGICSDIETIANIVHSFGKILIVDEAHGAHFNFHSFFPKSAVLCGADIVIQSLHKTLPTLTQSSIIHVNGNRIDRSLLREWLSILQTSSPSYIFMGAIEHCIRGISKNSDLFNSYVNNLENTYKNLTSLKNINVLNKSVSNKIFDFDRGKLVFYSKGIFDKDKIEYIFKEKFKIQLELYGVNHFIAMTSIADTSLGFNRLVDSLKFVDEHLCCKNIDVNLFYNQIPHLVLNPKEAFYKEKDTVPLDKSLNEISATFIIPYPPGIPLVIPGEVITKNIIDIILMYILNGIPVVGVNKNYIQIIRR